MNPEGCLYKAKVIARSQKDVSLGPMPLRVVG